MWILNSDQGVWVSWINLNLFYFRDLLFLLRLYFLGHLKTFEKFFFMEIASLSDFALAPGLHPNGSTSGVDFLLRFDCLNGRIFLRKLLNHWPVCVRMCMALHFLVDCASLDLLVKGISEGWKLSGGVLGSLSDLFLHFDVHVVSFGEKFWGLSFAS